MSDVIFSKKLPRRIERLDALAYNLWWSWHPEARELFRMLSYELWRASGHNPVKLLRQITSDRLQTVARMPSFLRLYEKVMADFDADVSVCGTWTAISPGESPAGPVAYFSPEFALHTSLPIYAGGLGVLAGDFCKEAADFHLPLVGVGFLFPQGYFHQHIKADGWQEEVYPGIDLKDTAATPVLAYNGDRIIAQLQLEGRLLSIAVWQVGVGCGTIYLLDTNLEQNAVEDREFSARLYIANPEMRIKQEIVLGIGGVLVLRALGIKPALWHVNDPHGAFMMLELAREMVAGGMPFAEAVQKVRQRTVFTTHTPVLAGQDIFPDYLVEKYLGGLRDSLGLNREDFLSLGEYDSSGSDCFGMAALALKLAGKTNAVSQLHCQIARKMWHGLYPQLKEEEVPISHVTNGIHVSTWVARELVSLYEKYIGKDWEKKQDDTQIWQRIREVPDRELWAIHQALKRKMIATIEDRLRRVWVARQLMAGQVIAMGALLDPEVLTIGFCRRFTEYKRPGLIFQDVARLEKIVTNQFHPVQIVFAGKSHPADGQGKQLLHDIYARALDPRFLGRISFIEDYDIHIAHYLVQGVDVWLNNPRRLQEACGTSGMKAALNGVLHLSVLDGWWYEGYNGKNGWAIGGGLSMADSKAQDDADAETVYRLLEEEIVPLYYDRNPAGVPESWVHMMKESISSLVPRFCARRMLKEYAEKMYLSRPLQF
jgi:starch phosphorylase